jgi:SAM-dependent methyltransferase
MASAREQFLELLRTAVQDGALTKLTLGKYHGDDTTVRNVFVRAVALKTGPHLSFVWRHATRDVTKNFPPEAGLAEIDRLLGRDFLDAHLFATTGNAQFESLPEGGGRLKRTAADRGATPPAGHDRSKHHLIAADTAWLQTLGITNERGRPREGMADKFRQIQKFAELLTQLVAESPLKDRPADAPIRIVDMGSGKGYLTFAIATLLGRRAEVVGIEARPELVELCNAAAVKHGLAPTLRFVAGTIADTPLDRCDILIALHACDTATDDALARGIGAGATLLVVSPCCQKELRPQLHAPEVMADALRHGIFQERQAEFVTDALRAQLLEWAGFRTKVFEFISTEHTAKNLMIAGIRSTEAKRATEDRIRGFAAFYGIRSQRLAQHLGFALQPPRAFVPDLPT